MSATAPSHVVVMSARALADLRDLRADIAAEDAPLAAERYAGRLLAAIEKLERYPERGRRAHDGLRELTTAPPYVVRYRIADRTVQVLHIRHGAPRPTPHVHR